ncbi:hypothetical protein QR680_002089 [Steinernema hermaphroditum]|uniref:Tetraspanin n=1 Tax=Steinernema hermaphroditum TaxID=289476 RepID=A0AA39H2W8_9BILA|nr:hypothetical protein QR680_002089 [Steinernema hermaphroditum]
MLAEPRRSYILDLVDFSEDDPLLRFGCYFAIVSGITTLFVGFLACCGAIKGARCLLTGFVAFVIFIFFAELSIGVFALFYRDKFRDNRMPHYLANFSTNRYNRDKWVTPLMDTIQFYIRSAEFKAHYQSLIKHNYGVHLESERNRRITDVIDKMQFFEKCCGMEGSDDWLHSHWRDSFLFLHSAEVSDITQSMQQPSTFEESKEKPNVPVTCCMSMRDATVRNPVPRSLARCQQPAQQCCGGIGPKDYYGGYWYLTNKERGTQSFVPFSCCKQAQAARAWAIQPIDPMCSIYPYYSQAFNNSVHTEGCHKKLQEWFDQQVIIFAVVGFSLAAFQIIGICLAIIMCRHIHGYSYVEMKSVNLVFVVFLFLFAMSFGNAYILKRHYEYPRSIRTIYGMVPDFSAMMRVYGKRSDTDLLLE